MERETHVTPESNNILLKAIVLAIILICMGIIKAVEGGGDSANFSGRTKWLAIQILKTLPRVYTQTAENVFETKKGYDKIAKMFQEIWNTVFNQTPSRREGDS